MYPFKRFVVKTYAMAAGLYSFTKDDLFQGDVPEKIIVGLVSSAAAHGDYTKNPYHFQTFQCNYVGFYVNGQSTPSQPLQPNYAADNFIDAHPTIHPGRS